MLKFIILLLSPFTVHFFIIGPVFVSDIIQETRFSIDEEGCTGAAYTMVVMDDATGILIDEKKEIEFDCSKPFIFALSRNNSVFFLGVIENPIQK